VDILATDIDAASLERARGAIYDEGSLREVPGVLRQRHFRRRNHRWRLDETICGSVRFARHNLMTDPLPTGIDLVCCRYLFFTYYRSGRRLAAARRLWQTLRPGGALMIGRKEQLGAAAELFASWPGAPGIFRKKSPPDADSLPTA
jgi:chemotaxis methyl-accepting protein methylase